MKVPRDLLAGLGVSLIAHGILFFPGSGIESADAAFDQGRAAVTITLAPSIASVEHPEALNAEPDPDITEEVFVEPPLPQAPLVSMSDRPSLETVSTETAEPDEILIKPFDAAREEIPPRDPVESASPKSIEQDGGLEEKGVNTTVEISGICRPRYPRLSRKLGEEGTVLLVAHVSAEGRADSIRVARSSGYRGLDKAAQNALRKAAFIPARHRGLPVDSFREFAFTFKLENRQHQP